MGGSDMDNGPHTTSKVQSKPELLSDKATQGRVADEDSSPRNNGSTYKLTEIQSDIRRLKTQIVKSYRGSQLRPCNFEIELRGVGTTEPMLTAWFNTEPTRRNSVGKQSNYLRQCWNMAL